MDKSWIDIPNRLSEEYMNGADKFLDFAFSNNHSESTIYCPCKKCSNRYLVERKDAREHIIIYGFLKKYKIWTSHGERYVSSNVDENYARYSDPINGDDMVGMVHDAMGISNTSPNFGAEFSIGNDTEDGPNEDTSRFLKLLQEAECPLYPGCEDFTALSFIVQLLHLKVLSGWSDKSFTMLLELLKKSYPEGVNLPSSYYEANKITTELGFTYKTWDACVNNCMLFRNEDEKLDTCDVCETSRYKPIKDSVTAGGNEERKLPAKQVRYFPLKPRLQKLFMSSKTASLMKWHVDGRTNDGVLRHPADTPAWKDFDQKNPIFASDSRNVRLGLASDGFNPPPRVQQNQWRTLVTYWGLPKVQERCKKNRDTRLQAEMPSRMGRTSYAILRDQMTKEGEDISRWSMFIKTRTKKNGDIGDEDSEAVMHQMKERLSEISKDQHTNSLNDQIFDEILGNDARGRVRLHGLVPSLVKSTKRYEIYENRIREDERAKFKTSIDEVNAKYDKIIQMLHAQKEGSNFQMDANAVEQVSGASNINLAANIFSDNEVHGASTSR